MRFGLISYICGIRRITWRCKINRWPVTLHAGVAGLFLKKFFKKIDSHFNYITKLCFCQAKFFGESRIEFLDPVSGKLRVCRVCRGFTEKSRIGLCAAALPKMDKIEQMFYMRTIELVFDFYLSGLWFFSGDFVKTKSNICSVKVTPTT